MGEYVTKAMKPLKKDNIATLPKEDIQAFTILIKGRESPPVKKTISDSEKKARLQKLNAQIAAARLVEERMKVGAVKTHSKATSNIENDSSDNSSLDNSVKAKTESSSKKPAKYLSSEDDSSITEESDDDEKLTKADTKTTKKEITKSDASSDEWIIVEYNDI